MRKSKRTSVTIGPDILALPRGYLVFKRVVDSLVAGIGLVLSSPVWMVTALAILLEDGLPIFFTQERVGKFGVTFRLTKFRTMRKGDNQVLDIPLGKDPRVTRVGRILRATALDELPTLIHILRGDISFVGPKALAPIVYDATDPDHGKSIHEVPGIALRSRVSPGLTGLAQVYASKNCPYRHKFRYDSLYIKHLAFGLDTRLLAISFLRTFVGGWEKTRRRH